MLFYLLFGATLYLGRIRQLIVLSVIFAALVALRPMIGNLGAFAMRETSPLMFEFAAGMFLASVLPAIRRSATLGGALVASGLGLFVLSGNLVPALPRFIAFGAPATLIVAGAVLCEEFFSLRVLTAMLLLGDASYSIYLFHAFPLEIFNKILMSEVGPLARGAIFVASASLGVALYLFLERPLLAHSRSWLSTSSRRLQSHSATEGP